MIKGKSLNRKVITDGKVLAKIVGDSLKEKFKEQLKT
jgi:hypothetical protein